MDIPGILWSSAGVISSLTALLSVFRNGTVGKANHVQGEATHAMVRQIDAAVNGKPPGESPMVQQVQELHDNLPPREPEEAVIPLLKKMAGQLDDLKGMP